MPYFMYRGRYSQEATKALIEHPQDRAEAVQRLAERLGGKLHHLFFAVGAHDVVAIMEFPDHKGVVAASMLATSRDGQGDSEITPLLTMEEALAVMELAKSASESYEPPQG
ncbi:MAG: GYD domain-containing protein [Pseudomonadota bacterium]